MKTLAVDLKSACPLCNVTADRCFMGNDRFGAYRDDFPIRPGQTLVFPHRHYNDRAELEDDREDAFRTFILQVSEALKREFPDKKLRACVVGDGALNGFNFPLTPEQQRRLHFHTQITPLSAGESSGIVEGDTIGVGELPQEVMPLRVLHIQYVLGVPVPF